MDRVRLGRVLGRGARMAARTAYDALDAATASTPAQATKNSVPVRPSPPRTVASSSDTRATVQQAIRTAGRVHGSVRSAREGVLAPVKRASRAVTLEIAGSFYALFALSFGVAAWRFRSLVQSGAPQRLCAYLGLAAIFTYFAVSSFLRARRFTRA